MLQFILEGRLLRRFGRSRSVRLAVLTMFAALLVVVVIYTTNLFFTLNERTGAHHVDTHSTH
jgi:hypothetical protein